METTDLKTEQRSKRSKRRDFLGLVDVLSHPRARDARAQGQTGESRRTTVFLRFLRWLRCSVLRSVASSWLAISLPLALLWPELDIYGLSP